MSTWIGAQQKRLLVSHTATLGIGSVTTLSVASVDLYGSVRLLAKSLQSSYSLAVRFAQDSGTWLVSTLQAFAPGSGNGHGGQSLEFAAYGKDCQFVITNGASASYVQAYVHAVPVA